MRPHAYEEFGVARRLASEPLRIPRALSGEHDAGDRGRSVLRLEARAGVPTPHAIGDHLVEPGVHAEAARFPVLAAVVPDGTDEVTHVLARIALELELELGDQVAPRGVLLTHEREDVVARRAERALGLGGRRLGLRRGERRRRRGVDGGTRGVRGGVGVKCGSFQTFLSACALRRGYRVDALRRRDYTENDNFCK